MCVITLRVAVCISMHIYPSLYTVPLPACSAVVPAADFYNLKVWP